MLVKSPLRYTTATVFLVIVVMMTSLSLPNPTTAQAPAPAQCTQVLDLVQKNLSASCSSLNRGEACYGNAPITVEYQDPAQASQKPFDRVGDTVAVDTIKSLITGPLNIEKNEWGVAVLRVQVGNLAGTTAGQAVTFLLFGDVAVKSVSGATTGATPAPTADAAAPVACTATANRATYLRNAPGPGEQPLQLVQANTTANVSRRQADGSWVFGESQGKTGWLYTRYLKLSCNLNDLPVDDPSKPVALPGVRAFYFTTGVAAQAGCQDVPAGGMLIQSPGGHRIALNINGVDMTIGSTVVLYQRPDHSLIIGVLDGHLVITVNGREMTFYPGQQAVIDDQTKTVLRSALTDMFDRLGGNWSGIYLPTLFELAQALGMTIPKNLSQVYPPPPPAPPAKPTAITYCTERTFLPDGTVCMPNYGFFPCNHNGVCDPGEQSYTCWEDCGAPPPTNVPQPPPTSTPVETPYYGY